MDANYYDYLTQLPTMTYFFETSTARKESIKKNHGSPAILFITLHGLKSYNQKNGFPEGNKILQSFAKLLSNIFDRENCCRLGGAHFTLITEEEGLEQKLSSLMGKIPLVQVGGGLYIHIGIYPCKTEEISIYSACDRAKLACDSIKDEKVSAINYYDQKIRLAEENHRYIIENFNRAIAERWITVYYQPIIRAVNGKVCDEEALARWIDPIKGFLSPADFIPVLEEEKLIYKLDLYVLERVLEKMKFFQSKGIEVIPQSINLSRSDFESCDIVEEIRTRVDLAGFPRNKISIEITESVVGSNFDFMLRQINRFKDLGFPVWMDDFGSGYSSLNVLKEIPFDLIKFDMSFMRQFNEKNNGKIILTELMRMAFSIGADTICEGVESEEQLQFLKEIGCSKIQGYYYCKPIPIEQILERIEKNIQIGFENPDETHYYEAVGRVNLHDLAVISYGNEQDFSNVFNMLPMAIIEVKDTSIRFVRTNQSYRNFFSKSFGFGLMGKPIPISEILHSAGTAFIKSVLQVAKDGKRTFTDEILPDGSQANYFIRRLAENPITKRTALAVAVLSVKDSAKGSTYANIAKALAADYFHLFYVNLKTEEFIEYSTGLGEDIMTSEKHGENFFEQIRNMAAKVLLQDDKKIFLETFYKENILSEIDEHGRFAMTYQIMRKSGLVYVNMKVMRMKHDSDYIIIALSNVDSQIKQQKMLKKAKQDEIIYSRLMALSGDFICMYIVDPKTESYTEYNASKDYESLGISKQGNDFFATSHKNAKITLFKDDVPLFIEKFTLKNIIAEIEQKNSFSLHYRLMLNGELKNASLRAALVKENGEDKLIIGIRI